MLKVVVGSTSEHKLRAVREALDELSIKAEVTGAAVPSGVNEQPVKTAERDEILEGAMNRASLAHEGGVFDISIGIENGIESQKTDKLAFVSEFARVVLLRPKDTFIATSAGHPVNIIDAEEARRRGFDKHTVASVTAERTGCDATDATPHYTGGRMTRVECLKQAVKLVLCQWLASKEGVK
jgi:non-canonical (house-cleaning) NTP pyrophosphatase